MSKFTSAFANYFEGFLQYKESHGHTRKPHLKLLEQFDQYCAAKYPNVAELTKNCVLGWIQKHLNETSDSFGLRTRLVRQLGEYMVLMSVPVYILPHKLGVGKASLPHIFLQTTQAHEELRTKIRAFAETEVKPNAGSDSGGTETTAIDKGDHWLLNGQKIFITNGSVADTYVVFAVTTPDIGTRGISAFIVEKGWKGFTFEPHYDKTGIRSSETSSAGRT